MINSHLEAIFNQQFEESRAKRAAAQQRIDYSAALTDYIKMSQTHVPDADPLARSWKRDGATLDNIRTHAATTSSDFANALESATKELLVQRFADLSGDIKSTCADLPVDNFLPQSIATLGLKVPTQTIEELPPPKLPIGVTESEKGALKSYCATLSFSYALWTTRGETILAGLSEYANLFYLLETQRLAAKLESATLPTSATTPLTATGLGKAAAALRLQQNSAGQAANLAISTVIVPCELEVSARIVNQAVGNIWKIVALPLSSATTFYVLADPAISAPLARLSLRGSKGPRLELNRNRGIYEGVEFSVSHDFLITHLSSQPGILKCTA